MKRILKIIILSLCFFNFCFPQTPKIGDAASNFILSDLEKNKIELNILLKKGPVVLIVLRGWPGYQCPICTRQVGELIQNESEFKKLNSSIWLVYPGPSEFLNKNASEFIINLDLPSDFYFTPDPDYKMVKAYSLRWDAPRETAYPSTFIFNKKGKIIFSKVSHTHGDRSSISEIIDSLKK